MDFEQITYEKSEGITTITLNRPERMNAFTNQMIEEWYQALLDANADQEIRVIIVTGAGRGFCAGADLARGRLSTEDSKEGPRAFAEKREPQFEGR